MILTSFITPEDYGADPTGVTDSTTAVNSALAACNAAGGGIVLALGVYLVSGTVSIPPFCTLWGDTAISLNQFTTPPATLGRIVAAAGWAPSSSTGIVSILSKTPGGWSQNTMSCGLHGMMIDGSLNASANLQGVNMVGPVYDVHLDDVFIWKAPHHGITASGQTESGIGPTFPYHHRYSRVSTVSSGAAGFNIINYTDSTFDNCLGFGNTSNNWSLQNNSNSVFTACRAEWSSGGRGFDITGSSGSIVFSGCTSDQNFSEGLRIHATSQATNEGGGIIITGGKYHADGNGGTNNTGIKITGNGGVPVLLSGVNVEIGRDVNNATNFPNVALSVDTSSNVTVDGCVLQGITTSWSDGGGNTNLVRKGVIGQVGAQGSQTTTLLQDLPYGVPQVQSSATTVTGVTAETVLQTYTVPANEPIAGSVYHVTGYGVFTAASGNLTWTVRWGGVAGTIIASLPTNAAPVLTNGSFWYDVMLTFRSSTSVTAAIKLDINSSTVTDAATSYVQTPSTATTVTTSSASALVVDITPSVSGDSITLMGGCTRKLA